VDLIIPTPNGFEALHASFHQDTFLPFITSARKAGNRKIIIWFNGENNHELSQLTAENFHLLQANNSLRTPDELRKAERASGGILIKLPQ
jgi:hypothetical protein